MYFYFKTTVAEAAAVAARNHVTRRDSDNVILSQYMTPPYMSCRPQVSIYQ